MRVLVTGGAGYVGSHTVHHLVEAGYSPIVFDDLSYGHRASVPDDVPFFKGTLHDRKIVDDVMRTFRPEAVFHFAGSTQVGESVEQPGLYYRNNVVTGLNLLDAMVEHGIQHIVFSSTAAVYGEPQQIPIPEDHPKQPSNPYGETKLFFENILHRYEQAHGIRSVSLRYFNAAGAHPDGTIGEDHTPETHLIPLVLQVALQQQPEITIFGDDYDTPDGTCIRDYVHVCDLAQAHRLALQSLQAGEASDVYNLGNGNGFSVREVIEEAEAVVGQPIPYRTGARRPGDPAVLVASSQKAKEQLGWKPQYPELRTMIQSAWDWHRTHPNGYGK